MAIIGIEFEDLGPIKGKTKIDLKPFTIFFGENNTGKSYAAMLIYVLLRQEISVSFEPYYGSIDWRNHTPKLFDLLIKEVKKSSRFTLKGTSLCELHEVINSKLFPKVKDLIVNKLYNTDKIKICSRKLILNQFQTLNLIYQNYLKKSWVIPLGFLVGLIRRERTEL